MQNQNFKQQFRRRTSALPMKSAMEDFLFILVISLAVSISMFSKKQQAERFAIPTGKPTEQTIAMEDYANLLPCELPEGSDYRIADNRFGTVDALIVHLQQHSDKTDQPKILLRISRKRQIGEIEDLKTRLLDRGWTIFTEWEKQQ